MVHKLEVKLDHRIIYILAVLLIGAAAVSASSVHTMKSPEITEQPIIQSNVVNINANELKEMRMNEADVVFTEIKSMEKGYVKSGDAKEKIQDYKYNAKDFNSANTVEMEVNQHFIDFCNSALDCTNAYYYGVESDQYKQVYDEMLAKKNLI